QRTMKKIAIVGGGITGLSAAFYLHKWSNEQGIPLEIKLYEASNHLGGKVQTVKQDGFTMERGADSFLARKKPGMKLMEDLRLEDQLYRNKTGQSYVLVHNQLHKIPAGSYMGIPIQKVHCWHRKSCRKKEKHVRLLKCRSLKDHPYQINHLVSFCEDVLEMNL